MIIKLKRISEILLLASIASFFIVPFFAGDSIGIGYGIILPVIAVSMLLTISFTLATNHKELVEKTKNKTYTKKEYIIAAIVLILSIIVIIFNFSEK